MFGIAAWEVKLGGIVLFVAGVTAWHFDDVHNHVVAQQNADIAAAATATAAAKVEHDQLNALLAQNRDAAAPALNAKMSGIQAQLAQLLAQAKKPPQVFTADCKLPKAQVDAYNDIR